MKGDSIMKKLKQILGFALSAILFVSLIGCGRNKTENASKSVGEEENVEAGRDEIVAADTYDFVSYDPFGGTYDGEGFYHYSTLVYEPLVDYENNEFIPRLATSWEKNDDTTWTFHLREGIKFTDGSPFNAETVKLNLEHRRDNEPGQIMTYLGIISKLKEVNVVDEYTVEIVMETPYYPVLENLCEVMMGMMSSKMFENGNNPWANTLTEPIGTGPYRLDVENSKKGSEYLFIQNEDYWDSSKGPSKYKIKIIPDLDSKVMALKTGEIDLIYGSNQLTYDVYEQLNNEENIGVQCSDEDYFTRNIVLNAGSTGLDDVKVRKAIQYAINKEELASALFLGLEKPADALLSPELKYCDISLSTFEYDVDQANTLLDKAGWNQINNDGIRSKDGEPLKIEIVYQSTNKIDEQICLAFKEYMREVGIDVTLTGYEMTTWFSKGVEGAYDAILNNTYSFPRDPHVYVDAMTSYGVDKPSLDAMEGKEELFEKIQGIFETTDEEKIQDNYTYVFTTLQEQGINLPISYSKELAVYNTNKIKELDFSPLKTCFDIRDITLVSER